MPIEIDYKSGLEVLFPVLMLIFHHNKALPHTTGNSGQHNIYIIDHTDAEKTRDELLIDIISIALFTINACRYNSLDPRLNPI
jgi:hypothetical protein